MSELSFTLEYGELVFKFGMLCKYCNKATYSLEGHLRPLASGSRPCEGHTCEEVTHYLQKMTIADDRGGRVG